MHAVARSVVSSVTGLGREEEILAMLAHPRPDPHLRIAVRSGGIDMVDAEFEQEVEDLVSLVLVHPAEGGGAENYARAEVTGFSEPNLVDHFPPRRVGRVAIVTF